MLKEKRTFNECVAAAIELAEVMELPMVNYPDEGTPYPPGLVYQQVPVGRILLIQIGDEGHQSYPFGGKSMAYAEFWTACVFAINAIRLFRSLQPEKEVVVEEPQVWTVTTIRHDPRCAFDCRLARNKHDLCHLCVKQTREALP